MKRRNALCFLLPFSFLLLNLQAMGQDTYGLSDPYSDLWVLVAPTEDSIAIRVEFRNEVLLHSSGLDLEWYDADFNLQRPITLDSVWESTVDVTLETPHYQVPQVRDYYRALFLSFEEGVTLEVRAYASGMAFRWVPQGRDSIRIKRLYWSPRIASNGTIYTQPVGLNRPFTYNHPLTSQTIASWPLSDAYHQASIPMMIRRANSSFVLTRAHNQQFPVPFYRVVSDSITQLRQDYHNPELERVVRRSVEPGETQEIDVSWGGTQPTPWEVALVARDEGDFLPENLVYLLNPPAREDYSWVKRGAAIWPAGNSWNLIGVNFLTGCNQATYDEYLEFAIREHIDYLIVDSIYQLNEFGGFQQNPNLSLSQLSNESMGTEVRIIVSVEADQIKEEGDILLSDLAFWGVAGIKVSGLSAYDAEGRRWLMDLIGQCAEKQLLLLIDQGNLPDGLERTYPHVMATGGMNYGDPQRAEEGVEPSENVLLSRMRLPLGAMHYGVGAMEHASQKDYHLQPTRPVAAGTRCHQMAMAILYDQPVRPWVGIPQQYEAEPMLLSYYRDLPLSWERIIPQHGTGAGYSIVAKRKGDTWYVAALNDWTEREIRLDLGFLSEGRYEGTLFVDGINAGKRGEEYRIETRPVDQGMDPVIRLASGGGAVLVIRPLD